MKNPVNCFKNINDSVCSQDPKLKRGKWKNSNKEKDTHRTSITSTTNGASRRGRNSTRSTSIKHIIVSLNECQMLLL